MEQRRDRGPLQNPRPLALLLVLMLVGCGYEEGEFKPAAATPSATVTPSATATPSAATTPSATATPGTATTPSAATTPQSAPRINGTPNTQALVNQQYLFQPSAFDANGDPLVFGITGKPAWMAFNGATGRLSGTPTAADVRTYPGITIRVSDGAGATSLQPFDVEVVSVGVRSTTLSWIPPTENEDGSPLQNLAGYRIRYGIRSGEYDNLIELNNPGLSAYALDNLVPNTYYIVMSAYNMDGIESSYSNPATVTLN